MNIFLSLPIFSSDNAENIYEAVSSRLYYQWEIKNYLGLKEDAEHIYKQSNDARLKELAFLYYWLGSAFYHYHKGEFSKILEDLGGLNLYWGYFKGKRYYEDLYYEFLGKLYILLFQYKRAVIFLVESYKLKPLSRRFLDIIYATELAYYDEFKTNYDYSPIKKLLELVNASKLNVFEKALYEFEKGFYYLLTDDYEKALTFFKKAYNLDRAYLTDGQANFFMGKTYEGLKQYKNAYLHYKLALKQVKHPIFKLRTLYRLFYVSAKLGYYQEANDYYYALAVLNPLPTNYYLQDITAKLWISDFLDFFYWKDSYDAIMAKILWLNSNNNRGKLAFLYFLDKFLKTGEIYPDFAAAWQVFEVEDFKNLGKYRKLIDTKGRKIVNRPLKFYKNLELLSLKNPELFKFFFGDWGYLALAYYYFYLGKFDKANLILETVNFDYPLKVFVKGVIEATKGKPYYLETYLENLPEHLKTEALFWLGYGYLLNNRWNITALYWKLFLRKASNDKKYKLEKIFVLLHLAEHYKNLGYTTEAAELFEELIEEIGNNPALEGLKEFASLQLISLKIPVNVEFSNTDWQNFIKYLQKRGK